MADGAEWGDVCNRSFAVIDRQFATALVTADWQRCRPWIEAAVKRGQLYSIEDIEAEIAQGLAHFWPGRNCAAVTQFIGEKVKTLNFWLLGGDLEELLADMRPAIEHWAKAQGCTRVQGTFGKGRRGWERVLSKHGYGPLAITLGKEL